MELRQVDLGDSGKLEYQTVGSGRDLLILHSLLSAAEHYADLAGRLSDTCRVHLVHLPGFGGSDAVPAPDIRHYAERLLAALDRIAPEGADLMGNGFGGFVAGATAARAGSRIRRLALVDTGSSFPEAGRAAFTGMARAVEAGGMERIVETALDRLFPAEFIAADPGTAERAREALLAMDPVHFATACRTLETLDLDEEVAGIAAETLVLSGTLDTATPPAMGRALAGRIPGARYEELPGVGHAPHLQAPGVLAERLREFLAGAPAGREARAS